jgi:hypothetical protein
MKKFEFHGLVLAGLMGFGAIAAAQSVQLTAPELTAKAEQMGQQTFKQKSGKVLTFQQIYSLPSQQRDVVIDEMTEQEAEIQKPETLSFLKSVLALPDLFSDK